MKMDRGQGPSGGGGRATAVVESATSTAELRSSLAMMAQLALQLSDEKARLERELLRGASQGGAASKRWTWLLGPHELRRERLAILRRALKPKGGEERQLIREYIRRRFGRSGVFHGNYEEWVERFGRPSADDISAIRREVDAGELPRIGVIVDLRSLRGDGVQRLAASLKGQLYPPALIVAVGGEMLPFEEFDAVQRGLSAAARCVRPGRLYEVQGPPVEAWLLVDAAVVLREHASAAFACTLRNGSAELVYADEDRTTAKGGLVEPFFKPAYSPLLAGSTDYMGACGLVRWTARPASELIAQLQLADSVAQLLTELAFRSRPNSVAHIPIVLFSAPKPAPRRAGAVAPAGKRQLPTVSIVIPTKDKIELLRACIDSIEATTSYPRDRYEIVIVDNGSQEPESIAFLDMLAAGKSAVVVKDRGPFNYSRLNNEAVSRASGRVLVFLNNDTEVMQADWLERLVAHAMEGDVGAVGAKLLYPDMTVQHGGVILGLRGGASHSFTNLPQAHPGYHGLAAADREVSAVTGACLAIRRTVFDEIGGFDENLAVAFNDTLLCIEAMRRGYRNLILGSVVLLHHESKSRGVDDTVEKTMRARSECLYLWEKGGEFLRDDRFYSPNLSLVEQYGIAWPPRHRKPWRRPGHRPRVLLLTGDPSEGSGRTLFGLRGAAVLAGMGYDVHVGTRRRALASADGAGIKHTAIATASDAAVYAAQNDIDCIVCEVEAYNPVVRWVGNRSMVILCGQYGPRDALRRSERDFAVRDLPGVMAHRVFDVFETLDAIGIHPGDREERSAVQLSKAQSRHLQLLRQSVRAGCGWLEQVVVLHACRPEDVTDRLGEMERLLRSAMDANGAGEVPLAVLIWSPATAMVLEQDGSGIRIVDMAGRPLGLNQACAAADLYVEFRSRQPYALGRERAEAFEIPVVEQREWAAAPRAGREACDVDVAAESLVVAVQRLAQLGRTPRTVVGHLPLEHYVADLAEAIDGVCNRDGSSGEIASVPRRPAAHWQP